MDTGSRCSRSIPEVTLLATQKSLIGSSTPLQSLEQRESRQYDDHLQPKTKEDYKEIVPINYNINCHTDGSKLDNDKTGAGVLMNNSQNDTAEEDIYLGTNVTVL